MLKLRSVLAAAAVLLFMPVAAHAQRALSSSFAPSTYTPSLQAPTAADSVARPFAATDSTAATVASNRDAADVMAPSDHANVGPNVGLMIIGGAAIVTGSVIGGAGGSLIAVGGAVVGLYGLYKYLH
jgi:hypothetical protein